MKPKVLVFAVIGLLAMAGFVVVGVMWPVRKIESAPIPGTPEHVQTGSNVDMICLAIDAWERDFGKLPPVGTTLSELIRRKPKTDDFRHRDGYDRPFVLIDEEGVLIGAYSLGANGIDERGLRDDVTCMVR